MVKLVIQSYTREAGVRNLERNLAALARAAAVKFAEQEEAVPLRKDVQRFASPLLGNRLADGAEVEMEVIPMSVNHHDISGAFKVSLPLIVDEATLEKLLGGCTQGWTLGWCHSCDVSSFTVHPEKSKSRYSYDGTLRGLVLPVGGIKDKVLAAHRYGVKRVILPGRNLKDLVDVPPHVLSSLEELVSTIDFQLEYQD